MASGDSMDDGIREGAASGSSPLVRPEKSLVPAIRQDQPRPTSSPPPAIRRRAPLPVSLLVGLKRFLIERAWSALPLGAALGSVCGWLWTVLGLSGDSTGSMLIGLFLGLILGFLWWSCFWPPTCRCGLHKGAHYRVITSFSSGNSHFKEGQVVVFIRERAYIPFDMHDPGPEHDLYDFIDLESGEPKMISGLVFPTPIQWVSFLEEIPAGTDIR
jgi:hypothetical protein